jgi:hypothetical protein
MPGFVKDECLVVTTYSASHRMPCAPAPGIRDALPPPENLNDDLSTVVF